MTYLEVIYGNKLYTDYPNKLCKYLVERFELQSPLVDVGPGRGEFTLGFRVAGIKSDGYKGGKMPYDRVATIFTKSVIEHNHNFLKFLSLPYLSLKDNGKIIIMTPDWNAQWKTFWDDPTHVHPYTLKGLENALKMAGFEDVRCERFYQLPILWKFPWLRLFLWPFSRWAREAMILGMGVK